MPQPRVAALGLGLSVLMLSGCGLRGHLASSLHPPAHRTFSVSVSSSLAPPLTHYNRYKALIHTIEPILICRSVVPVYLPTHLGWPGPRHALNVVYQTHHHGYRVSFNPDGNIEVSDTIWGFPVSASSLLHRLFAQHIPPAIPGSTVRTKPVALTRTVTGTLYALPHSPEIAWHQGEMALRGFQ